MARLVFGLRKPRINIPGSYFSGEVAQVGNSVSGFKEGDRVCGINGAMFRSYAEYLKTPEKSVLSIVPEGISFEEAAPVALGLDSLHFIRKLKLKQGETLLINGAGGGIGTYAVQLAKLKGLQVTAVDSADKEDMLRSVGADNFIDYTSSPVQEWPDTYDAILDVVGTIPYKKSLRLLSKYGRYVSAVPEVDRILLSLMGSLFTSKKVMSGITSPTVKDLDYMVSLLAENKVRTVIDRTYTMDEIVQAHKDIEAGRKCGNAILKVI
jgi:NADPH:quinone reductase-like Zn-dependent oxidoreductase